jgi:hypothetical protein
MEHQVSDISNFYLTLRSDGDSHISYKNNPHDFTIHFETPIILEGRWEVGLAEIFYKMTIPYLTGDEYYIRAYDLGNKRMTNHNLLNYNRNVQFDDDTLIRTFRMFMEGKECQVIEKNKFLTLKLKEELVPEVEVELESRLMNMLGLSHLNFKDNNGHIQGHRKVDGRRGLPGVIKVMTDLIHHQVINNGSDRVLRNVALEINKYRYGCETYRTFEHIHYYTVSKQKVDSIHIYIKDEAGRNISFSQQPLTVILHFRKIQS